MCGRFVLDVPAELLGSLFDAERVPNLPARYNIAPTQPILGVRETDSGSREGALFQWGLIPHWAKEPSIGARMINARSETAAEKPAFRTPFKRRRCLIPASGWYEWKAVGRVKQPYYIRPLNGEPLAFAALWDVWERGEQVVLETCSILTMDANADVAPIHHRMPVILPPDDWDAWLDRRSHRPEELQTLLRPLESGALESYPVSRRMNSARVDDPLCVEPDFSAEPQGSAFRRDP